jgi:hypothetical protein
LRNEAIIANIATKINRESVERENIDGLFKISFIGLFVIGNCRPIGGDSGEAAIASPREKVKRLRR